MLFRQSAVTNVSRDTVVEESPTLPVDIHPALLGSGRLAISLDATGLQGLNTFMGHYPDCFSLEHTSWMAEKHLHIYRDRAISRHYAPEVGRGLGFNNLEKEAFSLLPLGYLDYSLTIDGVTFDTEGLRAGVRDWRREFSPRRGLLVTSFTVAGVRVRWAACPGVDEVVSPFRFEALSEDGTPHDMHLSIRMKLGLRDGRPIATGGITHGKADGKAWMQWAATNATSAAELLEPGLFRWTLAAAGKGEVRGDSGEESITLTCKGQGQSLRWDIALLCGADYDDSASEAYSAAALADLPGAIDQAVASWNQFTAEGMDVHLGEPAREYLQACAQYTLRAGVPWDNGVPLGTLWTQKFGGMTFWDSFFAVDGLLRGGRVTEARRFADWCVATAAEEGRPHYWMTWYEGTPGTDRATDEGYQSTLAFAQSIIRLCEVTGDDDDIRLRALPYLRKLGRYAFESLLTFDEGKGWRLKGTVAHDVGIDSTDASAEHVICAWLVSCLGKLAEYADRLGETDDLSRRAGEVAASFREPSRQLDLTKGLWNEWAPNLTQSQPFADYPAWGQWLADHVGRDPLLLHRIMPWASGNTAVSLAICDQPDVALQALDLAHEHISGLGYLGESLWEFKCGGNTPYIPSSGVYLSAIAAMIVDGTIWDDDVRIGLPMSQRWRNNRLSWRNVTTLNGARTSGRYEPMRVEVTVDTRQPIRLRLAVPSRIVGNLLAVEHNGTAVDASGMVDEVVLSLPAGAHKVTVARDEAAAFDVLLLEPSAHGRRLREMLARDGRGVYWLRDTESLPALAARAPVIVYDSQYVMLRPDHVAALAEAAKRGTRVVLMHHAACRRIDWRMAELTGLNAEHDRDYVYTGERVELRLTDTGASALPGVPEELATWTTARITPHPAEDVEVLATLDDGKTPAVTRRHVGAGWVAWACMGDKLMDRWDPQHAGRPGEHRFNYGWAGGAPFSVFGEYPDDQVSPKWLDEPGLSELLNALVAATW